MLVKEADVWRMVHREEFENVITPGEIQKGMSVRILLQDEITDFTGSVVKLDQGECEIIFTTGLRESQRRTFSISNVVNVVEILSYPLLYKLRTAVSGEREGKPNIRWEKVKPNTVNSEYKPDRKPRMLLEAQKECSHKRVWHFFQIFPRAELEYCTKVALKSLYENNRMRNFNAVAYFAA